MSGSKYTSCRNKDTCKQLVIMRRKKKKRSHTHNYRGMSVESRKILCSLLEQMSREFYGHEEMSQTNRYGNAAQGGDRAVGVKRRQTRALWPPFAARCFPTGVFVSRASAPTEKETRLVAVHFCLSSELSPGGPPCPTRLRSCFLSLRAASD